MLVRVWNDNVHPFSQKIADKVYSIPPKACIEMDQEEADRLVKAFSPITVDYDNNPRPESYKMLRIDEGDLKKARDQAANKGSGVGSYLCQACGKLHGTKEELNAHVMVEHKEMLEDVQEAMQSVAKEARGRKKA